MQRSWISWSPWLSFRSALFGVFKIRITISGSHCFDNFYHLPLRCSYGIAADIFAAVCVSLFLCIYLAALRSWDDLFCFRDCLCICLPVCLFDCLYIYVSVRLCVYFCVVFMSACTLVCPNIYPFVCLFLCLFQCSHSSAPRPQSAVFRDKKKTFSWKVNPDSFYQEETLNLKPNSALFLAIKQIKQLGSHGYCAYDII